MSDYAKYFLSMKNKCSSEMENHNRKIYVQTDPFQMANSGQQSEEDVINQPSFCSAHKAPLPVCRDALY